MNYINEHAHVSLEYLKYNKPYIIMYVISIIILIWPKQKLKLHDIFLLIGLGILSFMGVRQIAIFAVVSSRIWAKYVDEIKENFLNSKIFKGEKFLFLRVVSTIIILFAIFYLSVKYHNKYGIRDYVDESRYPVKSAEWIKENLDLDNLKIYNNYTDGSYLVLAGVPDFIDTRCDLFTAEFNSSLKKNEDIFSDSMNVQDDSSKYKEVFEKYDINSALVNKHYFYIKELETDEEFEKVYEDENYIVYLKKEL